MTSDRLMTRTEAAEYLGLRPATLEAWASRKTVLLPYSKLGRAVRYRKQDLDHFIAENRLPAAGIPEATNCAATASA